MTKIAPKPSRKHDGHWTLGELNQWSRNGLLPAHESQDIEYMCAFFGALDVLTWFSPEILTLVHGSAGCGTALASMRAWPGCSRKHRPKPLFTAMDNHQVIFGGHNQLWNALFDVDHKYDAKLIVVLTNCCSYITGEDVGGVVDSVAPELATEVSHLEVAGCSGSGFRKGSDAALELVFKYVGSHRLTSALEPKPSINLFTKRVSGRPAEMDDVAEIKRLLKKIGVSINTVVQLGTTRQELRAIPNATANATLCFTFGNGPLKILQREFGQPYAPMTFPLGLSSTLTWINQIADLVGVANTLPNDPEVAEATKKIDRLRNKVAGRKAYVWQPGEKGLATAVFASELGLKPILIGMSYYMVEQLRPTVEMLLERGFDMELVLQDHYDVLISTREMKADHRPLIFMPKKFLGGQCPGVTFDFFSDSIMGLKGVDRLIAEVEYALTTTTKKDYRLFNRYVIEPPTYLDDQVDGDIISGIAKNDRQWKRWNQK